MTNIQTTVAGHKVDLDEVDPRVRTIALTIAFGSSCEENAGWWNHIGTAREVLRVVESWED
jgi:hypothetical protein